MTYSFPDLPPVDQLGSRLRLCAALPGQQVALMMTPDYTRQLAHRLDCVAVLEGQLEHSAKANALLERQFAERDDAMISLQNRHVSLVVWNIVGGAMACAAIVASWVWS